MTDSAVKEAVAADLNAASLCITRSVESGRDFLAAWLTSRGTPTSGQGRGSSMHIAEELGDLVLLRHARLERLDLSGAQLQSPRFFGSRISGCRLDKAARQDWRMRDTEVPDCSFAGASLRDAVVGTWREGKRNTWRRADLSGAAFDQVEFMGLVMHSRYRKCWAWPLKHDWVLCEHDYADRYM